MKKFLITLGAIPLYVFLAQNSRASCTVTTAQDVLTCALERHPDIVRAKAQAVQVGVFQKAASQRVNPEVNAESTFQSNRDQPALKLEAAYLHTFELGGKRNRRIEQARAQEEVLLAQIQRIHEDVALSTVLSIYRLPQLEAELHAIDETLQTFDGVVRIYRGRPRLTPEQNVSVTTFGLAEESYKLQRSMLLQEKDALNSYFTVATGLDFSTILPVLSSRKTEWPEVGLNPSASAIKAASLREAQAAVALSRGDLGIANSLASPELRLGPKIDIESGRGQDSQGIGGALSMGLPFYHRNQGSRALASLAAQSAEISFEQRQRELSAELRQWHRVYAAAVTTLKATPSLSRMEEKHENLESLFRRGLITTSLVIEAHRQMIDFVKEKNIQELRAAEALWSIYKLEGRILEEKL